MGKRGLIRKCPSCKRYTLMEVCPKCGERTRSPHPPKFSPEDRYGEYRRKMKLASLDP
ncbi:MAG: RNA-protein complex protein Nop10 [Thermoprotei archaeon]|nr:MAG: RNA-protein complex protein Nop10 [Thermoprotei archaeon]